MFKKYKFLLSYIRTINKNKEIYSNRFNMKFDWVYRGYTVLTFPPDIMTNIDKYGYDYLDTEVKRYISDLTAFNKEIGLVELVGLDRADKIGANVVLIVTRYRFLNTKKLANRLILFTFLALLATIGILIFF